MEQARARPTAHGAGIRGQPDQPARTRARARYRGAVPAASIADELTLVDLQVQLCEWRKFRNHVPGAAGAARGATPDGVADPAAKQPKQPPLKRARKD